MTAKQDSIFKPSSCVEVLSGSLKRRRFATTVNVAGWDAGMNSAHSRVLLHFNRDATLRLDETDPLQS